MEKIWKKTPVNKKPLKTPPPEKIYGKKLVFFFFEKNYRKNEVPIENKKTIGKKKSWATQDWKPHRGGRCHSLLPNASRSQNRTGQSGSTPLTGLWKSNSTQNTGNSCRHQREHSWVPNVDHWLQQLSRPCQLAGRRGLSHNRSASGCVVAFTSLSLSPHATADDAAD